MLVTQEGDIMQATNVSADAIYFLISRTSSTITYWSLETGREVGAFMQPQHKRKQSTRYVSLLQMTGVH